MYINKKHISLREKIYYILAFYMAVHYNLIINFNKKAVNLQNMNKLEILEMNVVDNYGKLVCKLYELGIEEIIHLLEIKRNHYENTLEDENDLVGIAIYALKNK